MKLLTLLLLIVARFSGVLGGIVCASNSEFAIISLSTPSSFLPLSFSTICSNVVLRSGVSPGYFATILSSNWSRVTSIFSQGCQTLSVSRTGIWINGPVFGQSRVPVAFVPPINPSLSSTTPTYSVLDFIACAYVTIDTGTSIAPTVTIPTVTTLTLTTTLTEVTESTIDFIFPTTSTLTLTSVIPTTQTTQITETSTETFISSKISASTTSFIVTSFSLTTTSTTRSVTSVTLTTLTTSVTLESTTLTTDTTFICPSVSLSTSSV